MGVDISFRALINPYHIVYIVATRLLAHLYMVYTYLLL